jgi:hypothetical protein
LYFSEAYEVETSPEDDWFDPLMEDDTRLFVDPFLVYAETSGRWSDADRVLSGHFQRGFEILAGHQDRPKSVQYRKTIDLMLFPEPSEVGLGFVRRGTGGAGTGRGFARRIVEAMALAIEAGLSDLTRFEELGVLVEKIGRDRISDITCNLLKAQLIAYTQDVCDRHQIPMRTFSVRNARFDEQRMRWIETEVELPANPLQQSAPVILVPKRFLRELPTMGSDDWWDYLDSTIRDDLNWDIGRKLRKADIVRLARQRPDLVRDWTTSRSAQEPDPYDVDRDPEGLHSWQMLGRTISHTEPIEHEGPIGLSDFVRIANERFKHFIEQRGGWELLYNDESRRPKREASIQLLYRGLIEAYCAVADVRLDREVNLGRGPVDFTFTSRTSRVLMEIKKLNNGDFWNGLEHQLTSYLTSEQCRSGWFVAVQFSDTPTETSRAADLSRRTRAARAATGFELRSIAIDARRPLSASNISALSSTVPSTAEDPEFPEEK